MGFVPIGRNTKRISIREIKNAISTERVKPIEVKENWLKRFINKFKRNKK
jgi:hypothetical protein